LSPLSRKKRRMREIVLDTETTGLKPEEGHRIVEIGALELINHIPSGRSYHCYLNPERDIPREAVEVHGLTLDFLRAKPRFAECVSALLAFIADSRLIIHNAPFDLGFLNSELTRANMAALPAERVLDTLLLARQRHPMGPNSLDALCKRYNIDATQRDKHGALLDAELLAQVYLELIGGRQAGLDLASGRVVTQVTLTTTEARIGARPKPLVSRLSPEERERHAAFVAEMGANALWNGVEKSGR
jgi:DNA polymerase III subunit epsilon